MGEALQRAWLRRGPLACALWPLSLLFLLLSSMRRAAYRAGWLKTQRLRVPVVVVGNVIAGGSGKTPIVRAIAQHLRSRGWQVGIVSRGYGRTSAGCREVLPASTAAEVGDEPLLLARTCGVPVFVAARRVEAAHALLQAHPATQVIVSDDGLQHHALERDVEICVFDDRGTGNGWLLPAGPLREKWPRPVDFVLRSAGAEGFDGFVVRRRLADEAVRADGARMPLNGLKDRTLNAVAAIAKPQAFFEMLRGRGLALERTIALRDHDDFHALPEIDGDLVCTEKDAVKLWHKRPDAWAVPLRVDIDDAFWHAFDQRLGAKLSSPDGSQTA